ncbi:MAG: HPF/RaiA family ribosome-associated protein [Thermoguttaceae bacterium]|nr:HPF/RaiA family ribosome-associated protein [Thermoguttaceae bacterium]
MELFIRHHGVQVDDALREQIEKRIGFALQAFEPRIKKVDVRLEDINAHRGGMDKYCQIIVYPRRGSVMKVEDFDPSVISVIGRAADRLGYAASRRFERRRSREKIGQVAIAEAEVAEAAEAVQV